MPVLAQMAIRTNLEHTARAFRRRATVSEQSATNDNLVKPVADAAVARIVSSKLLHM
jgi:hypothetical protein